MDAKNVVESLSGSPRSNGLRRVICVCERKDIAAWTLACRAVVRHIVADEYQLICPDTQMDDFEKVTCGGWTITGEGIYSENCGLEMIRGRVTGENLGRVHWLFQQFLKINAVTGSGLDDDDVVLIWDADTVPLRKLDFVDGGSGRLLVYHGKENHQPYFKTIERVLGYGKLVEKSFIAQCLPVRVGWVRQAIDEVERNFDAPFASAILGQLPGKSGSEFSEYETLGTWVLRNHPERLEFKTRNRWLRSGSSFLRSNPSGPVSRRILGVLSLFYDFVAIERWSRPLTARRVASAITRFLAVGRG